jgi:hypothetical protein
MEEDFVPISPMSWYWGSHDTTTVSSPAWSSEVMMDRLCAKLPNVIITPLGSLVEPDVNCKNATSPLDDPDGDEGSEAADGCGDRAVPAWASVTIQVSSGHEGGDEALLLSRRASLIPANFLPWLYSAEVRAYRARQESQMTRNIPRLSRRLGWGGNTGTATTLAFRQAKNATMKSRDGGYTRTTLRDKPRDRF